VGPAVTRPVPAPASASVSGDAASRRAALASSLAAVRHRIDVAAEAAGRASADVTLVVVTKTFPAADVEHLAALGVGDVGENRDQEAAAKAADCEHLGLRWHFIGRLQTNKAGHVARYADVVHSVDRPRLVAALARGAAAADRVVPVDCLLQVSLDGDVARGGAAADDVLRLADLVTEHDELQLRGVMAVPPLTGPMADADRAFATLADIAGAVRAQHPDATWVSAGMSHDLEQAIAHGATHVRVGTAILGQRTPPH